MLTHTLSQIQTPDAPIFREKCGLVLKSDHRRENWCRLNKTNEKLFLMPENKEFEPIEVREGSEIYIWGVVTNVIHSV